VATAGTSPVVVLDAGRPEPEAYGLCQRIRRASGVPLLVVGAPDGTLDKVRALRLGADVCLDAPVDHLGFLAYLRALLRRTGLAAWRSGGASGRGFAAGELSIDFVTHEVRVGGRVVPLTATEYRLLETLARHAGTTLPHGLLLERVWGPAYARDTPYLKVFVRRLRRKLGDDAARPRYLHTTWGVGYRRSPATPRGGAAGRGLDRARRWLTVAASGRHRVPAAPTALPRHPRRGRPSGLTRWRRGLTRWRRGLISVSTPFTRRSRADTSAATARPHTRRRSEQRGATAQPLRTAR
jgi:two-component system KDP operon response regulator KdpE